MHLFVEHIVYIRQKWLSEGGGKVGEGKGDGINKDTALREFMMSDQAQELFAKLIATPTPPSYLCIYIETTLYYTANWHTKFQK